MAVTLDSTSFLTTADSSKSQWVYLPITNLDYQPFSSTNLHIHIVLASDPQNKYRHPCLVMDRVHNIELSKF
jgi:hypothetical protein